MMTDKLYYQDATLKTFTAHIVARLTHEGHPAVVLDRTAFYPAGGGQPSDRGKLGEALVVDVIEREADGAVIHVLSTPTLPSPCEGEGTPPPSPSEGRGAGPGMRVNDQVTGELDWPRRFDLMQQHTGQHILSEAFIKTADAETIGFHLTDDNLTIDLNKRNLDQADVDRAQDLANQIVFEDRPVIPRFVNAEELAQMPLRKPPKVETDIRIVEVEGFDWSPCGGTHVARTGQVGLIKIVKLDRHSDALRVEFRCGGRALADYSRKHQVLQEVAGGLSIGFTELGQAVAKMQAEDKELYKKLAEAESKLLLYQAAELDATAEERGGLRLITSAWTDRDAASLRTLAKKLVGKPRTVVLLGSGGRQPMLVLARSTDLALDLVPLLRGAIERIGGKGGGGKPDFCQGGGPPASEKQVRTAIEWVASQLAVH
jgi:alanyl-tRNA synthetase